MKDWCLLLLITAPRILCTSRGIFIDDPDAPFYVTATRSGPPEVEGGVLAQQRSNIQ